jgi:hypothetical protein
MATWPTNLTRSASSRYFFALDIFAFVPPQVRHLSSPKVAEAMIRNARPQIGLAYKQDAIGAVGLLGYS